MRRNAEGGVPYRYFLPFQLIGHNNYPNIDNYVNFTHHTEVIIYKESTSKIY